MTYLHRTVEFSKMALVVARNAEHVVAALVVDATILYRVGGFLGLLIGLSASVLASQSRRLGR